VIKRLADQCRYKARADLVELATEKGRLFTWVEDKIDVRGNNRLKNSGWRRG
jgi:hypothetical protein